MVSCSGVDGGLQRLVLERLHEDDSLDDDAALLIMAACDGADELLRAIDDDAAAERQPLPPVLDEEEQVGVFLDSVTVEGFRGIGPQAVLPLTPGPGLTLVVGRNGSGKSSFAEALEVLLTGDNRRWAKRSAVWKEGWRNLHHDNPTFIEAGVIAQGRGGRTSVRRTWAPAAAIDGGATEVCQHGKDTTTLDELGWRQALASYRPFLSYNELGSLLDEGPSKLYDALSAILGLDAIVETQKLVADARKHREKAQKSVKKQLPSLLTALEQVDDERARKCHTALASKKWDLDGAEAVILGIDEEVDATSQLELLRQLAALRAPVTPDQSVELAAELREAHEAVEKLAATAAGDALESAELLERGLTYHDHRGDGDCPVCGATGALDDGWRAEAKQRAATLRQRAEAAKKTHATADAVRARATKLLRDAPAAIAKAATVDVDASELAREWSAWAQGPAGTSLEALAVHVEERAPALSAAAEQVRERARVAIESKQEAWSPVRRSVGAWIAEARTAQEGMARVPTLKAAEDWLKHTATELRDQRFAPIAEKSAQVWELLRTRSNVELGEIRLEGTGTRRRVTLDVRVDGADGAALGVMSQGELHSLALSLFLPRATLPESPFRFIVIDDPVQSMDPARVDGLAQVFNQVAADRQVIVFTHDDRLPIAVRELGIDATILEVSRRPGSLVELRQCLDPVERYLDDARALALTETLPVEVGRRAIPGYCRAALEAACIEAFRRRRLTAGEGHNDVEAILADAKSLRSIASLALFDDIDRGADVVGRLNKQGREAGDAFIACNKGAHGSFDGDLRELIKQTKHLAQYLRTVP